VIGLGLTEKNEGELEVATVSITEQFQTILVPYYKVLYLCQMEYFIFLFLLWTSG
jgi:hypothetical protein